MAPTLAVIRKTYFKGKGPQRVKLVFSATYGAAAAAGGYTITKGFCDDTGSPNNGINLQSIIPEPIIDYSGRISGPNAALIAGGVWGTGFTTALLGTAGILDFDSMTNANYTSPPTKRMFVRLYGLKAGPVFSEASTQAANAIVAGSFSVELNYTSVSGAEA